MFCPPSPIWSDPVTENLRGMRLASRVNDFQASPTLAVAAKAAEMQAAGIDVVALATGEPDFPTPAHIIQAAKKALDAGFTSYAKPASGLLVAKQAVCEKLRRENGLQYQPDQVIITVGGKEALWLAFMALVNPGDQVLVPVPYWVSFPEQVRLTGGEPVLVPGRPECDGKVTPKDLLAACTPRTRMLIFNSPSNPGGFTYTQEEVQAIADALANRNIIVLSDEMYDRLTLNGTRHFSFAAAKGNWLERTITTNAGSKTYSMTGWRVGYAAGPRPIINAMAKLQGQMTTGTATFTQIALAEALGGDQSCVEEMRCAFERRGNHMYKRLCTIPGLRTARPTGAFYCFPDVSSHYKRLGVRNSAEFCQRCLEQTHLAIVPGSAFGSDTHVRISFAASMEQIDKGLDRLERFLRG
jgi:aspartate aminotransferase